MEAMLRIRLRLVGFCCSPADHAIGAKRQISFARPLRACHRRTVVERLCRWNVGEIAEKSDPFTKTDGQTIEFCVQVPAGQGKTVTYKAHYTW